MSTDDAIKRMAEDVANTLRHTYDDFVETNADFRAKAGLKETIVRTTDGKCCEWCSNLAGTYEYTPGMNRDVFRRHKNCGCLVTFRSDKGIQNVHTKKWADETSQEVLEKRKTFGLENERKYDDNRIVEALRNEGVEYCKVNHLKSPISEQEIIAKIGGLDKTDGSCASLAFAYAGNKAGYDIIDYRGGTSRKFFASQLNFNNIVNECNALVSRVGEYSDYTAVGKLVKLMEDGKEYILGTGNHTAVIRKNVAAGRYEYLELQDEPGNNGFYQLTNDELRDRFKCKRSRTSHGYKHRAFSYLVDIDALKGGKFREIMGYINTAQSTQMKGAGGRVK